LSPGSVAVTHSIVAFEVIGLDNVARHNDPNFALKLGAFIERAGGGGTFPQPLVERKPNSPRWGIASLKIQQIGTLAQAASPEAQHFASAARAVDRLADSIAAINRGG
jgi:hypothetical protein